MWKSIAEWPPGTIGTDGDISTDNHGSEEEARGVCKLLRRNGFGGDGKIFPIKTSVEPLTEEQIQALN